MLRLQLELSQVRGELERKLQEKEEEAEAARYGPRPLLPSSPEQPPLSHLSSCFETKIMGKTWIVLTIDA